MSASLVGSEMCIRDSPGRPRPVRARGSLRAKAIPELRRQSEQVVMPEAVSYTHLTLPTICSV
eukprot:6789989-Alexandrium_andersonii.AAC.1